MRELAEQIAAEHGLEPDWLNDAAKGFLPGNDDNPVTVFESEHLFVQVPSAKYLLAMKLHSSRDERDLNDAATLWLRLGYATAQQGIDLLTGYYPASQLLPRHRFIVDDIAERAARRAGIAADSDAALKAELRQRMIDTKARGLTPRPAQSRDSRQAQPPPCPPEPQSLGL